MKANKYSYLNVIQQHYGYGWEDVSEYEANSQGQSIGEALHSGKFVEVGKHGRKRELTLLEHDVKEYRLTGYATRVIFRKELNQLINV
jgi:hypothetical protein